MLKTKYTAFLLIFLLVALAFGLVQAQEQPVFRIGVLDSERGPVTRGAQLAVAQINEAGGVRGADGTIFRLELVIQPTLSGEDLSDAIDVINEASVIAVLGPETTEQVLNNLPLLQDLGVPVLTPAIGDTVIASDSAQLLFRTRAAERFQGSALADYLTNILQATNVGTVQLDSDSTASRVGFSLALSQLENAPEEETLPILEDTDGLPELVAQVIELNPQATVAFGEPALASAFYTQLRANGYVGLFAYNQAQDPIFRDSVQLEQLRGVLSTTTWPYSALDDVSDAFLNDFVRAFGEVPGQVEAASYDAVQMLAVAIGQPGELATNLAGLTDVVGVQGTLNPTNLLRGETSEYVSVIQLGALGGVEILARYAGNQRLEDDGEQVVEGEPAPTATPQLDGVFITIQNAIQNVRTGPGLEYAVLGQLRQGETARVIGATIDFTWVVIEFRGQNGWLATYLLDVIGDRTTVPVITPPPTPTPGPATATPTAQPSVDVVILSAVPTTLTLGTTTNINVTVQNIGSVPAGPFAIASTLPPDNFFASANLPGLAPGQQATVTLPATLNTATGNFTAVVVADLNNEVAESPAGEANNDDFIFSYRIDRPITLINNTTLPVNGQLDLEGNVSPVFDVQYTAAGLNTTGACSGTANCVGLLSPTLTWDTSHYDAINPATGVNATLIANASLTPGTTIGILTAEGRRGVLRVDAINPGVSITLTYRLYQ